MRNILKVTLGLVISVLLIAALSSDSQAYTGKLQIPAEGTVQRITLADGSTLIGKITEIAQDTIKFQGDMGEMTIATDKIQSIEEMSATAFKGGQYWFPNPNRTRLLIGPTARTLKAGDKYFYDLWIFFPGLAYGVTDFFMISAGASVIPDADDQMFYIMPKFGFNAGRDLDLSASVTAFRLWEETFYFGLGGLTYGTDDRSLSCALGIAFTDDKMADKPAAMLGGEYRLSRRTALVGESWFIPGDEDNGMIGMGALRLMGEQITVDVGVALSYEDNSGETDWDGNPVEDEIGWIPYLDFVYNF